MHTQIHRELCYIRIASSSSLEGSVTGSACEHKEHYKHEAEDGKHNYSHHQIYNSVWPPYVVRGQRNILCTQQHVSQCPAIVNNVWSSAILGGERERERARLCGYTQSVVRGGGERKEELTPVTLTLFANCTDQSFVVFELNPNPSLSTCNTYSPPKQ